MRFDATFSSPDAIGPCNFTFATPDMIECKAGAYGFCNRVR